MYPHKLLFITESLDNGGQEKQLFMLLEGLNSLNISCAVYVNHFENGQKYTNAIRNLKVPVFYTERKSAKDKVAFLRELIDQYKPQIVHSYTFHLNILTWLACLGKSSIPVGALRSIPEYNIRSGGWMRAIVNFILPLQIISNNHTGANILKKFIPGKKVIVVENGVETSNIKPEKNRDHGAIRTISVGRISAEKRIDKLIDIIAALKERGHTVIHEHWGNGILKDELSAKVKKMNLQDQFLFKGETDNIPAQLSEADIYIHTSRIEGTPNVILEAMAQGKAIVTSNCGDVPFILTDKEDGFICSSDTNEEFVENCIRLIEHKTLKEQMGEKARQNVSTHYSANAYLEKTLNAYTSIKAL